MVVMVVHFVKIFPSLPRQVFPAPDGQWVREQPPRNEVAHHIVRVQLFFNKNGRPFWLYKIHWSKYTLHHHITRQDFVEPVATSPILQA